MNSHNIAISRFGMRCETCFMPLGEDFGCHYPECNDPCPPRDAVDSLNEVSEGPLPPAPHDWQKRFRNYESQLTDLREKLKNAEHDRDLARQALRSCERDYKEKLRVAEAERDKAIQDNLKNIEGATKQLLELESELSTSNPIAERAGAKEAVEFFNVHANEVANYVSCSVIGELTYRVRLADKIRAILSQLQEKEQ